ncbi:MAG: divergent PAP2 family protein [Treponema sp.]|nr:divergent PAP2 family protein [Treponema sp.]
MFTDAGSQIHILLKSPVFLACVFSWVSAQFIKTVIKLLNGKVHSVKELLEFLFWRTGSMPSSHSAVTACVCTCIGFRAGISSDLFILTVVFYVVTVRDAVGVRLASGIQAKRLNEVGEILKEKGIYNDFKKLKEVNGHTPLEVFIGSMLGFFMGVAFSVL